VKETGSGAFWPELSEDEWLARLGQDEGLITARDEYGHTLLSEAAGQHFVRLATSLLERGADPNTIDETGYWPLRIAAESGDLEMVRLLLKWKAHPTHPTLSPSFVGTKSLILWSTLYTAILHASSPVVKALIDAGADVNHQDLDEDTPLHHAVHRDRPDVVRWLLERGADTNAEAYGGVKPADVADNKAAAIVRKHQEQHNTPNR
jgi:ankyrin repeat protein